MAYTITNGLVESSEGWHMSDEDEQTIVTDPAEEAEKIDEQVVETPSEEVQHTEFEKKQFERAKEAEAENKRLKAELKARDIQPTNTAESLSREEAILIAQGMDSEDLDELNSVAKAKGLSLLKAKDTPLFQGYMEKQEKERKAEKARLSASRGSQTHEEKPITELSQDEHKKLFKETMAQIR